MSLYSAMLTGVSALDANSQALTVTSSNIANVNTIGYKTSTSDFETLLTGTSSAGQVSAGGVQVVSQQNLTQQGLVTATQSPTDLAISGNGYFVVNTSADGTGDTLYTRAGSFTTDQAGDLVNSAGYYLMGWQLDSSGNVPANQSTLQTINTSTITQNASPTSAMNVVANLQSSTAAVGSYTAGDMANGTVTPDFSQTFNVYDSQGGSKPMQLAFVKTAANTWSYELNYQGSSSDLASANPVASGSLTFNSDGTLASPALGSTTATIPWSTSTGLQPQTVSLNFGTVGKSDGMTQFDTTSAMTSPGVNGAPAGALSSISVDSSGDVTALFANGIEQQVYKVPLATFTNPDGLASVSGNAYQLTGQSGSAVISAAKTGSAGSIASSSLESSTVDLANEFTNLITTQRAYSAATRIITTADDMLQELMNLKQQ